MTITALAHRIWLIWLILFINRLLRPGQLNQQSGHLFPVIVGGEQRLLIFQRVDPAFDVILLRQQFALRRIVGHGRG